jgi:hypothetical protein
MWFSKNDHKLRSSIIENTRMPGVATLLNIFSPSSQPTSFQTDEDGADELAKAGGIDSIYFVGSTVPEVMVVQGTPRKADPFSSLIVLKQPLHL